MHSGSPRRLARVSKVAKTLDRILRGDADASVRFDDLCALLRNLGFAERAKGSHHMFLKSDVERIINIQRDGSCAKPYQVRQVRAVLLEHGLGREARP